MNGKQAKKLRRRMKAVLEKHKKGNFMFYMRKAKKAFNQGLIVLLLLLTCNISFADQIKIPFECYSNELQREFAKNNIKLDLSGNDRDKNSWGVLENKGAEFIIYTYKSVTNEELNLIQKIVFEVLNGKNSG